MTLYLYNALWHLFRPFIGVVLTYRERRGKADAGRRIERYGRVNIAADGMSASRTAITSPKMIAANRPIWLHAVSVGESVAALRLASALTSQLPDKQFLITTNTIAGAALIAAAIDSDSKMPLISVLQPLDHPDFVDAFLATWRPSAAIFMESDFWPNLILRSKRRDIPIIFASSQLSQKAFRRWQRRPQLARHVFGAADLILPVDNKQATQFRTLIDGATPLPAIDVIGSLKLPDPHTPDQPLLKTLKHAAGTRRIFLAASTHAGEDEIIIAAAKALGAGWLTIIAPRHPHRGAAIATAAHGAPQRSTGALPTTKDAFYIMDSLGEMGTLFSLADYVFLGGSLVPSGGHNPLEPAGFGLPILTGAHIFKNEAEFDGLAATGAIFEITDARSVADQIMMLEQNPAQRAALAKAAKHYVTMARQRASQAAHCIDRTLKALPVANTPGR